jgi:hypothetical protein
LTVAVRGIGLLGPGLPDWQSAQAILRDPTCWSDTPPALPVSTRLPPAERRRAGTIVKWSLAVAEQACSASGVDPHVLPTVFSASTGDAANCHALCEALAQPERLVSPTRFTNSVHNATAGYWHIATQSRAPSTSLCGFDASFGIGLLEAATQALTSGQPVLFVASDVPYPEPMNRLRPLPSALALALVVDASAAESNLPRLTVQTLKPHASTVFGVCGHPGLDHLRSHIPAGRGLPLLQALARSGTLSGSTSVVTLPCLDTLALSVQIHHPAAPSTYA